MDNVSLLEATLNKTIERLGNQTIKYESDIANLNAQIIMLQDRVAELESDIVVEEAPAKDAK